MVSVAVNVKLTCSRCGLTTELTAGRGCLPVVNGLLLIVSTEKGELVIRDLGNSFIHHQWTQLWNQVCMKSPDVFVLK